MPDYSRIRKELVKRAAGDARVFALWDAYISFLKQCPQLPDNAAGTAVHHILWRAEYPQFTHSNWNLIRLSNENHTRASALMFAAEPTNFGLFNCLNVLAKGTYEGRKQSKLKRHKKVIIRLYVDKAWSQKQIAAKYRVNQETMRSFFIKQGIEVRSWSEIHRWTPSQSVVNQVMRLYMNDCTPDSIGKTVGRSANTVRELLKRSGVRLRTKSEALELRHKKAA